MTSVTSLVTNKLKFLDGHVDTVGEDGEKRIFPPWGRDLHKKNHKEEQKVEISNKKYLDHLVLFFKNAILK